MGDGWQRGGPLLLGDGVGWGGRGELLLVASPRAVVGRFCAHGKQADFKTPSSGTQGGIYTQLFYRGVNWG